jgi:imidazolonepropionase-like amidohydrolase
MTVLRNCKVMDVRTGSVRETAVYVEKGQIHSFGDGTRDDAVIDLQGAYLLPGLFNCHAHPAHVFPFHQADPNESAAVTGLRCFRRGTDALRAGITTLRTTGTRHNADIHLRSMINKGWVEGPRIISAGRGIAVTGGHGAGSLGSHTADGPEEFLKRSREQLLEGADFLKIMINGGISGASEAFDEPQMTIEEIKAVVAVARSKNTYVVAHSGGSESIMKASHAGVRSFEHCYLMNREAARTVRENHGYVCPTLCVTRAPEWMKAHSFAEWTIKKALEAGKDHLESIRGAVQEGVKLIVGTDIPPGDTEEGINITVKETEYLVTAGLSPLGALQAATLNPAELMGIGSQVGVVEPGHQADLIAVRENPLENIQALRGIFFVMQGGRIIRKDEP